jgi:alkylation response protein AidB-like acyl-CoA dehydrogenase
VVSIDPLTPFLRVDVSGGEVFEREERRVAQAMALTAALLSGIASQTAEMAVAYAKDREQFGRPIGSFQAVKHLCADAFVRAEVARAAVDRASVALDEPGDPRFVDGALLLASEYAIANAKTCIQVYGGMGFTWEADPHLYLKRAVVLASRFGGQSARAEAVASRI